MRILIIILLMGVLQYNLIGQSDETIPGLVLEDSKVEKPENDEVEICGIIAKVETYTVTAKMKVQMSCNYGDPSKNRYENLKNKYRIHTTVDTNCQYYDSIYQNIEGYWIEKEKWSNKYNVNGDFTNLSVRTGMMKADSLFIPYISTDHEREGAYAIIFWNDRVYKIELIKSTGLGGLSSFLSQNFRLFKNKTKVELQGLVRFLDETKELIEEQKKLCSTKNKHN